MAEVKHEFPELKDWVLATDAAEELGLARQSVNKMITHGKFSSTHRIGSRILVIGRAELDALKKQRSEQQVDI